MSTEAHTNKNLEPQARDTAHRLVPNRRAVLAVIVLSSFLTAFVASSLNVAIPTIGSQFQISASTLGWVISSYMICSVSLMLPLGRLGDLTSRRTIMLVGQCVITLASVLLAFVDQWQQLLALRVLQGCGAACLFTTAQAIVGDAFAPEKRGWALGMSVAATYFGMSIGPVVGGFITHHLGWRWVFGIVAIVAAIIAVLAFIYLPSKQRAPEQHTVVYLRTKMDMLGTVLYITMGFCLTFGLTSVSREWYAGLFVGIGTVLFIAFILHERRVASPLVKPNLFASGPNFLLSNLSALLNYAATFAISYLISIYLQQVKGVGADLAGLMLITAPVIQTIMSPVAGRLSDRYSPFRLASIGMAICTLGLTFFCFVSAGTPIPLTIANLALVGFGFALFSSPNTNAIMSLVPREDFGIASSFVAVMRNFGMVISMAVITIIINLHLGDSTIAQAPIIELSDAMRTCFIIFAIVCALGVFTSLNRRSAPKSDL